MLGLSDPNRELLDAGALCRQLLADGSVYAFVADHRALLFPDELFVDLFPSGRGRPSVPVGVMAVALVLKSLEDLSDRQAAEALRCDIRWKVACGLALDAPGVHHTVFAYWRGRLRLSANPNRLEEAVRSVVTETGVLVGKRFRALDSTLLDDAVATQDTVTQLVSAIRRARRVIPTAAAVDVSAHDYDATGKPVCAWDDPEAKTALVSALVNDALKIIKALDGAVLDTVQADAVGLLALLAEQDVEPGETDGTWRIADRVAPDRIISTVDREARHMHKSTSQYRDGYKAHIAIEPETGIITASTITPANTADGATGVALLANEEPGMVVLGDSAYGGGQTRADLRAGKHRQIIKPLPLQTAVPGGFSRDDFIVDHDNQTVTCPAKHTINFTVSGSMRFGKLCSGCPLRERCTTSKGGRVYVVRANDHELVAARHQWKNSPEDLEHYRQLRPMVERSIAWLVGTRSRKLRYRGVTRNQLGLSIRVAALNLRRLINLGLQHHETWTLTA